MIIHAPQKDLTKEWDVVPCTQNRMQRVLNVITPLGYQQPNLKDLPNLSNILGNEGLYALCSIDYKQLLIADKHNRKMILYRNGLVATNLAQFAKNHNQKEQDVYYHFLHQLVFDLSQLSYLKQVQK